MAKLPTTLTVTVAGAKTIEALAMLYDICRRMDADGCAARPDEDEYQSAMEKALSALMQHQVEFLAAAPAAPVQAQGEPVTTVTVHLEDGGHAVTFDALYFDLPVGEHPLYPHPPGDAELTRLRAENAALIAERAAPVQPVQAPMTERERRAPARREEMAAFAAELKADPAKAQAFFQEAGILDASGNLMPQYGVQAQGEPVLYRKHLSGLDAYIYRDAPRDDKREAWEPLFLHPPRADAEIAPIGPREPDTTMVICPACASQFRAIPVEVQEEVERLRAALEWVLVYSDGAKGFVADSVRTIAQRALKGE